MTRTRGYRLDLPLAGNRSIRLALSTTPDGVPLDLALAVGFGSGETFYPDPDRSLIIPGEVLPELRTALAELIAASANRGAT